MLSRLRTHTLTAFHTSLLACTLLHLLLHLLVLVLHLLLLLTPSTLLHLLLRLLLLLLIPSTLQALMRLLRLDRLQRHYLIHPSRLVSRRRAHSPAGSPSVRLLQTHLSLVLLQLLRNERIHLSSSRICQQRLA